MGRLFRQESRPSCAHPAQKSGRCHFFDKLAPQIKSLWRFFMPAKERRRSRKCTLQTARSGRLNNSCSRSRDLTAINPAVPEAMKIAALAVSTAHNGNMSFAFSKSVPIAPAKGRGKRLPAWTNRRIKSLMPCDFADTKGAQADTLYHTAQKRRSNCPRRPRKEVIKCQPFFEWKSGKATPL